MLLVETLGSGDSLSLAKLSGECLKAVDKPEIVLVVAESSYMTL